LRRRDAVELLELIYASGKPTLANRVKALISRVFSFAVEKGILESSPVSGLRRIADEKPRERVLTDDEIRLAWAVFAASPVSPKVGFALRLALVLGQRAGEIAGMRTDELSSMEHAGGALWTVPAERTKSRRDHLVPLPPLAVSLIRDAMELSRTRNCPWVFPSPTGHTAISAHALAVGMARIAKRLDQPHPLANAPGSTSWRATPPVPHDLRRTCATRMRSLGVGADDVKRVLNHARTDVLGRHYDKYDGLREKRQALETSACELERIIAGGEAHVVIPLDPRRAEARRR
jgi:integrase